MPPRDLSQLLEQGAADPQRPGDVDAVWQHGQARRRRRRALLGAGSVLAVIAAVALSAILWQRPPAPFIQPGPDEADRWGPLAVVADQTGDEALIQGTLNITDRCVMLEAQGDDVLLVWPADATSWDAEQRTITYTNRDGSTVELHDGTEVSFGGGGDSSTEGDESARAWVNRIDWVSRPEAECVTDTRWWISDVVESSSRVSVPNLQGLPLAEAQERLESIGLRGEPVSGPGWSDPGDPEAVVVHQEPPAESLVPRDSTVGFRTAVITPELCDVLTEVPPRQGDAHDLAASDGFWEMLERTEPVAPTPLADDIRRLLDFHDTGQPADQAPSRALDRVTIHHDACHAGP